MTRRLSTAGLSTTEGDTHMALTSVPARTMGRRLLGAGGVAAAAGLLSGCLLTSPTWNQSFASHTDAVPLTAFTVSNTTAVQFECSPAYHGGTYPPFESPTWTAVASVPPSGGALDKNGLELYAASGSYVVPSACWRQDPGNDVWYASVRARQSGSGAPTAGFYTLDSGGLACVGDWVGSSGSWAGWMGHSCQETYSGSSTAIPFVIIHAAT
jgi:hypothetical protein